MKITKILFFILITFFGTSVQAIPFYTLENYRPNDYQADSQNWQLDFTDNGYLYVGNNSGLLEFNGNNWNLFTLPNHGTVRSVLVDKDKIYTGSRNEFGYWKKDKYNQLKYTSLIHLFAQKGFSKEEFWSIRKKGHIIYIQSFSGLFAYNGRFIVKISPPLCGYMLIQENKCGLFIQKMGGGLYQIKGYKLYLLKGTEPLKNEIVKFVLNNPQKKDELIIGTNNCKLLLYGQNKKLQTWNKSIEDKLKDTFLDAATIYDGNKILIGTLSKGALAFDLTGKFLFRISTANNLQSNIVHNIKYVNNDIWITLDNGISKLKNKSPLMLLNIESSIGTLFSGINYKGNTYLATNQGVYKSKSLFYDPFSPEMKLSGYSMDLVNIKDQLICGNEFGAFRFSESGHEQISDIDGSCGFKYIADKEKEYMIQATYSNFVFYTYSNPKGWMFKSSIPNLGSSINQFEIENVYKIWAISPDNGIYSYRVKKDFSAIESYKNYTTKEGLPENNNLSIIRIDDELFFYHTKGFYSYNKADDKFEPVDFLNQGLGTFAASSRIFSIGESNYLLVKGNMIGLFHIKNRKMNLVSSISLDNYNIQLLQKELKVIPISDSTLLVSTVQGIIALNLQALRNTKYYQKLRIENISYFNNKGKKMFCENLNSIELPHSVVSLNIQVSTSCISNNKLIRYRLSDGVTEWTEWSDKGIITILKPQIGEYKIEIQGYGGAYLMLPIKINNPWYKTKLFISVLLLVIFITLFYMVYYYLANSTKKIKKRYEHEQLIKEKEIKELQNKHLTEHIEKQQKDIFLQTTLVSKQLQVLNELSDELYKQKQELGDRYPNKLYNKLKDIIDSNRDKKSEWVLFEAHFNEAHQQFIVRIKSQYPNLSNTDIRLCCFLRMNLSSKEIASLLNMSSRSVELARYRLRTKFNLETKDNLVNFILNF